MSILQQLSQHICPAERLADGGVPSASIAFADSLDGKIETTVIANSDQYNNETLYQACSISKAIAALGVAKLVDQGHFAYSTKVRPHLPQDVVDAIADPKTALLMDLLTVEILLNHTSGLSQPSFYGYPGDAPSLQIIAAGLAPSTTPRLRFDSLPGSQVSYSGGGFVLLQLFLEHLLEKPFADIMQETVLRPLGMTSSRYGSPPPSETNIAKAHVTAYTPGTTLGQGYHHFPELAAAGLWTTPSDLLKAVVAIQISLKHDGFIKKDTATKMLDPSTHNNSERGSMAIGWGADATFFAHSGWNSPGYSCWLMAARGGADFGDMSLCIMTNSNIGHESLRRLVSAIFYLKRWPLHEKMLPCGLGKLTDLVPYPCRGETGDIEWKDFIGRWAAKESGDVVYEISEKDGQPSLSFNGIETPLIPGAAPSNPAGRSGDRVVTLVVSGLEMAFRLISQDDGAKRTVELVQKGVLPLRRS